LNILLIHDLKADGDSVTFGAVPYYRMSKPHEVLVRMFPEFDVITSNTVFVNDDILNSTNIVLFTRMAEDKDIDYLESLGMTWGVDVDDYWHLPKDHILYGHYIKNNISQAIENTLKKAHFVICTTEILADKVYEFNKNVHIIENGIDTKDPSWNPNKVKSERIRFGFTQGTTHVPDIMLINESVSKSLYDNNFYKKGQVVLCGFNGEFNKPSIYVGYERLLTDDLKTLKYSNGYDKELKRFERPDGENQAYKRIWATKVKDFGKIHDQLDIVVAPLRQDTFNECKSNIKMLEAGFMDCAVMCHNVNPYKQLMNKNNSFDLTKKTFFEWQRIILNNPELLEEKKAALKESVKHYELSLLTSKRKKLYESI